VREKEEMKSNIKFRFSVQKSKKNSKLFSVSSFDREERIKYLEELETRGIEEGGFHVSSSGKDYEPIFFS